MESQMLDEIAVKMKEAMKSKDKNRLNALRYIKSMLMENHVSTSPINELDVIIKHHKKLTDTLELYPQGDKREALLAEIQVVAEFMPKPLDEHEVKKMIEQIVGELDNPAMGDIMKKLTPMIKGKFDGKKASVMVGAALKK